MIRLGLSAAPSPLRILCFGAHCDDIEIGCGGAMLTLLSQYPNSLVRWHVFSSNPQRAEEARRSAQAFLRGAASPEIVIRSYRDGFFPYVGGEIKSEFEQLKQQFAPDLIFTHYRHDLHQDHRLICELTWNTFRNHLVLEYEIAKYDGDLGSPNFFVPLEESLCRAKIRILMENFKSQAGKHWFDEQIFMALMRLRGMEAASPTHYAEAFHCRKLMLAAS
jgi:LmbE family N-acetylglucosaminyl deacetylase